MLDFETLNDVDALVAVMHDALPGWDYTTTSAVHEWTLTDIAEAWSVEVRRTEPVVAVVHDEVGHIPSAVHLRGVAPSAAVSVLVALGAPEVGAA